MFRSTMLRGVSAGALTFVLFPCSAAFAQEALPTIDISSETRGKSELDRKSGDRLTGYRAETAASATKTSAPIMQTPVSVQTVTRETLDDQQAITIQDAIIGNVSGVTRQGGGFGGAFPVFNIRGFANGDANSAVVYYNGLRTNVATGTEIANVQSVEVVKGPASVLYGRLEPGGMIYLQSKRPRETPYYSFQAQAGKFGTYRGTADATGPLTTDKSLLYRLNADVSYDNSFVDFTYAKDVFVAPALTYHPIEQFSFFVEGQYQKATNVLSQSQNIVLDGFSSPTPGIPISRFLGNPTLASQHPNTLETRQLYYDAKYDITKDWSLTTRGLYSNQFGFLSTSPALTPGGTVVIPGLGVQFENFGGNPNKATVSPSASWGDFKRETLTFNVDLTGKVDTGPIHHELLVGVDYNRQKTPISNQVVTLGPNALNLYFPDYWSNPFSFSSILKNQLAVISYYHSAVLWRGVYAQDMISAFDDKLHVLLGGRYDWASTGNGGGSFYEAAVRLKTSQDQAFSPRVGVLYQLLPWLSIYGNYVESFGQANGVNTVDLKALPPQKGKQWEGGVKAEFFDKRLAVTAAYYDIWKSNIPYPDPLVPNNRLLIGLAESKGVELDVIGKIDDQWSVIANYAHQDARVVTGQNLNALSLDNQYFEVPRAGNWLYSVPANMGNVWLKYTADGDFLGLNVFGGVQIVGSSYGDNANSFKIGQYTLVNGGAAYSFLWEGAKLTAQVNVTNLNDARYYVSAAARYQINAGAPRAVVGSLRVEF